ncbi:hypothetical protein [Arabidopsis thaliana]|uniref:Uncharacterized protein AT4g09850 n=1 Tax=Arabidopsis thaliana TaxID=3702 RepID=Q9SZA0_ARATH|nr:hypothetical protein [Arabidopsis thaliana]CAB78108.1 hypothetical protein [Arabidopsis thaliana]
MSPKYRLYTRPSGHHRRLYPVKPDATGLGPTTTTIEAGDVGKRARLNRTGHDKHRKTSGHVNKKEKTFSVL